jgi:threonine aldolase
MKNYKIDLLSDTVTKPSKEMREAIAYAEVGDDVYHEDPTVNKLQEIAAKKFGKEDSLFVPSGTMGNLIAILTHCQKSDEVIISPKAHIYDNTLSGMAALAGVQPYTMIPEDKEGMIPEELEKWVQKPEDLHYENTKLICIANPRNHAGGTVVSIKRIDEICNIAKKNNVLVHLDGARIFNAAIALKVKVKDIVRNVDSVMFSLSKGLAAPVGSILLGNKDFIKKANRNRKMLGGGMRQAGILAAAGIFALNNMVERLVEDHKNAKLLAMGLSEIDGIDINLESVQTNMVYFNVKNLLNHLGLSIEQFLNKLGSFGIRGSQEDPADLNKIRFVTHYGIEENDIYFVIEVIKKISSRAK